MGISAGDDPEMDPFTVEFRSQTGGATTTRTVIAVVDSLAGQWEGENIFSGIYTRADVFDELSDEPVPFTTFRVKLTPGADAGRVASAMQTDFLDNSMRAVDTVQEIRDVEAQGNAFNNLFQAFMGLGLVVGVALLGVVSFRAVVERRHSIGMMRAIGYKSRMIQVQFLIESVFVTVLGSALGVGLGAWISFLLVQDFRDSFEGIQYSIPVGNCRHDPWHSSGGVVDHDVLARSPGVEDLPVGSAQVRVDEARLRQDAGLAGLSHDVGP